MIGYAIKQNFHEFWIQIATIIVFVAVGSFLIYNSMTNTDEDNDIIRRNMLRNEMSGLGESFLSGEDGPIADNEHHIQANAGKSNAGYRNFRSKLRFFKMLFIAELGSMSQFVTIILAAQFTNFEVLFGGIIALVLTI